MTRPRAAQVAVLAVALAAVPLPLLVSSPALGDVTAALAVAGMAAGASLAAAAGRPPLFLAAVAAGAGYASGLLATHGWAVPLSVVAATAAGALGAALVALAGARLDGAGFLALGLLAAAGGGAAVRAAHGLSAGALGPLPPLELPLPGGRLAVLGAAGAYHLVLAAAALGAVGAALLLARGPGPRWRAVGGDRARAAAASLRPAAAQASALAVAGGLSALGGALAAHATGVAGPAGFSPDAAALPLLAALLAGRGGPAVAALAATGAAVLGGAVLPAAGYTGPPDGRALGTGLLALTLLATLPARRRRAAGSAVAPPSPVDAPWPVLAPPGGPCDLVVRGLRVTAGRDGPVLVGALDIEVAAGEVCGLVGANGAGKTSALRAIEAAARRPGPEVTLRPAPGSVPGRVVRMAQTGGGWPGCTVTETLELAAAAGGGGRGGGGRGGGSDAAAWRRRLGLDPFGDRRCEELPASSRRLLEAGRVLLLRPAALLCDEPLAGLGAERAAMISCLRAAAVAGVAVVLADHDLGAVAALATRRVRLRGGVAEPLGGMEPQAP